MDTTSKIYLGIAALFAVRAAREYFEWRQVNGYVLTEAIGGVLFAILGVML